ncbi:TonB-dependent receptor [Gangjinia marincola]|uniref:TonB-dependent receptor n=1 Tax=Gangjinia marincola TaxID=578463 RepID=A0ABP3XVR8_9FLAO
MRTKFSGMLTLLLAFVVQLTFAQEKTISGLVTDDTGLPLPGVNVLVKDTNIGTQTDFDGNYSIIANPGQILVFSYQGFKKQELAIGQSNTLNVSLETDIAELEEVVILGYYDSKRETISSATTVVSAEQIESRPNGSFAQALQATSPGLNIATGNGQPGGNSVILLRGVSSINGNVEPLFIVDGVPVDEDNFRSINQADIETATVLKDAAATAIYGNRATGGVIVITTKRGKFGRKTEMSISSQTGYTNSQRLTFDIANSAQLLQIERREDVGVGGGNPGLGDFINNQVGIPLTGAPLTDSEIQQVAQTDTDWVDVLLRNGNFSNQNLSFRGGGENINFFTSLGYFEQEGQTRKSGLQRMTFRNNLDFKKDRLRINTSLTAGFSRNTIPSGIRQGGTSGALDNPFLAPYLSKPYLSPFNEDGSLNFQGDTDPANAAGFLNTPFITLNSSEYDTDMEEEIKVIGSINGTYDITDNLSASVQFGLDYTDEVATFIQPPELSIRGRNANDVSAEFQGFQFEQLRKDARLNLQSNITYANTFGDSHNVIFSGSTEYIYSELSGFSYNQTGLIPGLVGNGAGFVDGNTTEDPDGDGISDAYFYIPTLGSINFIVSQLSYFGRFAYDYDLKYGIDFTIRRDASSRFSEENRWGTFGAVGAFWNISRENFLLDSQTISNLKLRGSYGVTGNDRIEGGYYGGLDVIYDLYSTESAYTGAVGLAPSKLANPQAEWETTYQANIGLDFGLFQNKITGSVDVYDRTTENLFVNVPNTLISGDPLETLAEDEFSNISANSGTLSNKGVEGVIRWNVSNTEDFRLSLFANGSYNKNEIEELPGSVENDFGEIILDDTQRTPEIVGSAFNTFYAVRWAGVNPNDGTPLYLDRDGNVTSVYDINNRVNTGKSSVPVYQGGFGFDISYKGFSLSNQWSFTADVYRYNNTLGVTEDPTLISIANVSTSVLRAWNSPGDITDIPSLDSGATRNLLTDRYLENSSYLRLRNAVFAYNFQPEVAEKLGLNRMRVYAQAENWITFTSWRGFDPEFDPFTPSDFFGYPNARTISFGIDITL